MDVPLKGKYKNAKIFVRVFPSATISRDLVKLCDDKKTIYCRCLQDFEKGTDPNKQNYWNFSTDGVLYNFSQKDVYAKVMDGTIENIFKGHNIIVVAYGQTGTGKSLTALGLYNSHQDCGIAPRSIIDLFSYVKSRKNSKINIFMTCLEIKNTHFIDLLNPELKDMDQSAVKYVIRKEIKNVNEALSALYKAEGRRQCVDKCNYESHKTNFVMTLDVYEKTATRKISGKLHIVDLAGADVYGNISCSYKELLDVANGNLAKSQLEQFLLILCEDIPSHILSKYRLNTLIYYLRDSLNNHSILRFIGHIHTDMENLPLTLSMLRFAQIIRALPPKALLTNEQEDEEFVIQKLQQRIEDLERDRLMQSMLVNTDLARHITTERVNHMQNVANDYVRDEVNELTLLNVTDVTTFLKVFKDMYNSLRTSKEKLEFEIREQTIKITPPQSMEAISKITRRHSSRSKDNISNRGENVVSRTSSQITAKSQSKDSKQKVPSNISLKRGAKGSLQSSQTSMKVSRSVTSKHNRKKSSSQQSESVKELREMIFPEELPSHKQAYEWFMMDDEYGYKRLYEINRACAVAADAANREYIDDVKILRQLNQTLENRKHEHLQARMQKDLLTDSSLSDIESCCKQKVLEAEIMLVKQQENVLKNQTDLKVAMVNYERSKKILSEEFDKFCLAKFKTLIPELAEEVEVLPPGKPEIPKAEAELARVDLETTLEHLLKHDELQRIMFMERKRTAAKKRERDRKWII